MSLLERRGSSVPLKSQSQEDPSNDLAKENSNARSNTNTNAKIGSLDASGLKECKTGSHEDEIENEGVEQFKQLGAYMQGVQTAIGGAYKKMSDSLMASTTMLQRMNEMMEQYVCRSITVVLRTEIVMEKSTPEEDKGIKVCLVVKVGNTTDIPLSSVQVLPCPAEPIVASTGAESAKETEGETAQGVKQVEPKVVDVLEQQGEVELQFETTADSLRHYALHGIKIVVSLPSPGTARRLETVSVHPVYYSNLCRVEKRQCVQREDLVYRKEITNVCASDLRRYLQLSPFDSLCVTYEKDDPVHAIYDRLAAEIVAYIDIVQVNPANETCTVVLMAIDEDYLRLFQRELVLFLKHAHRN